MPAEPAGTAGWQPYAWALALVAGSTGVALLGRDLFHLPDLVMLYLLAIVVASYRFERGPSIAAAALSVASYDYFFVPPFFTLSVEHARHALTFAMMFGLGLVTSNLASRLRAHEREAREREARTAALYALSRELVGVPDAAGAAAVAARHAAAIFACPAAVLLGEPGAALALPTGQSGAPQLGPQELNVARWASEHVRPAGFGTQILPETRVACIPLSAGVKALGVLVLERPARHIVELAHRDFLEAFARQAAFALERMRLAEEAREFEQRARSEAMRGSLLSAVSHDLRTPLATITGAATALRDAGGGFGPEERAELIDSICTEAERMERLVGNVLDMVRIESGAPALRVDWVPLEEIVGSALVRLEARLKGREVSTELPADLPLLSADPVLLEQVFVNLLENAEKYTPAGSPIAVAARAEGGVLVIEVSDRGPGIPAGQQERIFEKFHRSAPASAAGVGLGLAICRGIVEAHGGTIVAANRAGGGAVFRIRLPLREAPAATEPGTEPAAAAEQRA